MQKRRCRAMVAHRRHAHKHTEIHTNIYKNICMKRIQFNNFSVLKFICIEIPILCDAILWERESSVRFISSHFVFSLHLRGHKYIGSIVSQVNRNRQFQKIFHVFMSVLYILVWYSTFVEQRNNKKQQKWRKKTCHTKYKMHGIKKRAQ